MSNELGDIHDQQLKMTNEKSVANHQILYLISSLSRLVSDVQNVMTNSSMKIGCYRRTEMSRVMRKPTLWFPTWSDTNQAVQLQKMAKGLKFRI